ncbi:DNA excision repair protein ERCC-6-like isoform X2 [Narcine bancroftii]|uniref:DNA excision repair protein ERCC-6-like isoform X2 n=1 Tax=Narcine bancroftii TaxID=1343680 RepID=UPI0038316090
MVDVVATARSMTRPDSNSSPELSGLSSEQEKRYRQCVAGAKERALAGELRPALELLSEAQALRPSARLERRIRRVREALEADEDEDEDEWVPVEGCGLRLYRSLAERLHPHQRGGVAFLHRLYAEGRGGGILADDMGLGKTVQLLAFLSGMFDAGLVHGCLVLMPASLLATWLAEFAAWTPGLRVKAFHGSKAERSRNLERVQRRGGVVVTTYQLVIYNVEQLSHLDSKQFTWDYMVLDEAHKIKSQLSKTSKQVNAIPAKNRVLLTGTPVQNNLQEMWALFDFACQGSLLGPLKTFKMMYESPITRAREKDATPEEKALGLRISESLMQLIQPYFLRRTKEGIQKLGALPRAKSEERESLLLVFSRKKDLIIWVHLSPVQEEIYRKFVSSELIQELLQTRLSPLVQLNNLKKLCDHPRLLSKRVWEELGLSGAGDDYDIHRVSEEQLIEESGKLVFLLGLLERLREEGHRTLVFSQSRKMLDIIQRVLKVRGFALARMDGTLSLLERQKVLESFQNCSKSSVFLLTTQVGGVGLTLTAADRVVIVDPSWNPATDSQAVDRAYRIGQTSDVVIYRLVTCGTVEEKIYRRQIFKDSLIRQSVGEKKNPYRYFSRQELRELFVLEDTRQSSTQRQLQSLHASQWEMDPELDQHVAFLHSLPMFGVTDHNLVHLQEVAPDEECRISDPASQRYIQERVRLAQDLVVAGQHLQRGPGQPQAAPGPPTIRGGGGKISETDFREPIDLMEVPIDRELEDEVYDLSGSEGAEEARPGKAPLPTGVSQLLSNGEVENEALSVSGGDGRVPEPDSREPIDLTEVPIDREMEDEVSDLSGSEGGEEAHPSEAPLPINVSELLSNGEVENGVLSVSGGEGGKFPEPDPRGAPLPIDLLQLPSNDDEEVANLSCRMAELPISLSEQDDSVVLQSHGGAGVPTMQGCGSSMCWDLDLDMSVLPDGGRGFFPDPTVHELRQDQTLEIPFLSSSSAAHTSLLQPDFQLVLEDTVEEDCMPEARDSSDLVEEPARQLCTLRCEGPDSSDWESPALVFSRKKHRARVIDSDSEGQADSSSLSAASPFPAAFKAPAASTPKELNLPGRALQITGANCSLSSRRSLVRSVMEEMEDVDEDAFDEPVFVSSAPLCQSDGEEESEGKAGGDHSDLGDLVGSDEEMESEAKQSGTFEPELSSNEQMEPFAKATGLLDTMGTGPGSSQLPKVGSRSLEDLHSEMQELTGVFTGSSRDREGALEHSLQVSDSLLRQSAQAGAGAFRESTDSLRSTSDQYRSLILEVDGLRSFGEGVVSPGLPLGELERLMQEPTRLDAGAASTEPPAGEREVLATHHSGLDLGSPSVGVESQLPVGEHHSPVTHANGLDSGTPSDGMGPDPPTRHHSPVTYRTERTRPQPLQEEYESLVKRGREQMERGELKAALGCLLQALDLKSGDPEVQLTTIKLYRLLDTS